jgi:ATP-binding cassette subfamily F protein 3
MRIALAKLLLQSPGLLLLDEPTNHLDLYARNWLEEFLANYAHSVILVSHDRYFLDAVVTRIADLSLRVVTDYAGNYSHYLEEHTARLDQLRQKKREQDEEIARMRLFIDRFRYKATKAAQVQSRLKMLEKITPIEVPPERKRVHFKFPDCAKSGRTVLELKGVRKAYGNNAVFRRLDLHIERGDRIALIGPNGAGKSTLMRMLSGVEAPDAGERTVGHQVVMQYFAQDEATRLDPDRTVHDTLADGSPLHMVPMIRTILGGFLFEGDDVYKKAAVLSGGERTRLAVARMLLRSSNTLLLDEPTNHLDLDSKDVLLDALEDFGGTLILVSHDRYFIDRLATKIVEVGGGEGLVYPGGYEAFLWSREQQDGNGAGSAGARSAAAAARSNASPAAPRPTPPPPRDTSSLAGGASREEKKRLEAEERRQRRSREALEARIAKIESTIAAREQEMRELESAMAAPGFYQDHQTSKPLLDRHHTLMWEIGDLMHQWEELSSQVENVERR